MPSDGSLFCGEERLLRLDYLSELARDFSCQEKVLIWCLRLVRLQHVILLYSMIALLDSSLSIFTCAHTHTHTHIYTHKQMYIPSPRATPHRSSALTFADNKLDLKQAGSVLHWPVHLAHGVLTHSPRSSSSVFLLQSH